MTSAINVAKMLPTDLFERAPNGDKRPILAIKWRYGEMAERTKAPVSKTGIPSGYRGFESHSLRQLRS